MDKPEKQHRGARFLLVSASLVIVVAGLREIKPVALPLLIAIFLTVLSSPVFVGLCRRRVPRPLAIITTVLMNLAVLLAMGLLIGGSVSALSEALPSYRERAEIRARSMVEWLETKGVDTSDLEWLRSRAEAISGPPLLLDPVKAPNPNPVPFELETPERSEIPGFIQFDVFLGWVGSTLRGLLLVSGMILLVVLMMIFILIETAKLPTKLEVGMGWKPADMERLAKAQREVQHYLIYKTLISLATGVAAGLWVYFLDVRFPALWALLAFLLNYIPSLGSIIAAAPPLALAWIDDGTGTAILVGVGYLFINITLGNFLEPQLMGRRLGISPLVVFLSLIFWGWLWGPIGMLLSVPLTMILRIALENTEDFRWLALLIAANAPAIPEADPLAAELESSFDPGTSG